MKVVFNYWWGPSRCWAIQPWYEFKRQYNRLRSLICKYNQIMRHITSNIHCNVYWFCYSFVPWLVVWTTQTQTQILEIPTISSVLEFENKYYWTSEICIQIKTVTYKHHMIWGQDSNSNTPPENWHPRNKRTIKRIRILIIIADITINSLELFGNILANREDMRAIFDCNVPGDLQQAWE